MTPRAMLFDMDGVLVRSEEVWFRTVESAGTRFRGSPVTREEFLPTYGQGTAADVSIFKLSCTPAELDAFYFTEFPRFLSAMWVNPEAANVLKTLSERSVATALATNTVAPLAEVILRHAGLLDLMPVRATADLVKNAKPAPDLLLHGCRMLKVEPSDTWMVGDSRYDRQAAQSAGMRFAGLGIDGDVRLSSLSDALSLSG